MYKVKGINKRNNKAISDIVAVVMLILIAIAAAVLIYLWLSGLVGSVHTANPALTEKIQITSVSIVYTPSSSGKPANYTITAYVQNLGSATVAINSLSIINASSGIALNTSTVGKGLSAPVSISPGSVSPVTAQKIILPSNFNGTPIIIEVTTTNGVQATYQTVG